MTTTPKSRWTFSLRTLFVAVTVAGVAIGLAILVIHGLMKRFSGSNRMRPATEFFGPGVKSRTTENFLATR